MEPTTNISLSSIGSSQRDSGITFETGEEECRGDYEMVDFEIQGQRNPAPNYPAPSRPPGEFHSYALIDLNDGEDSDGYEEVRLGHRQGNSIKKNKPEFASPTILRGLPSQPSLSRSRSRSPPHHQKIKGRLTSSSPPTDDHLVPLDYPRVYKSSSPGSLSTSDSEPLMEDLDSIRAKLRRSAEESVKAETGQLLRSETTPALLGTAPGPKPRSTTTPVAVMPSTETAIGDMQVCDYDHLSSVLASDTEISSIYSYATQWNEGQQQQTTNFATYDILKSPTPEEETSPKKPVVRENPSLPSLRDLDK